jgi:hypothetical protein
MADVAIIQGQIRDITNSGGTILPAAPEGNANSWHLCQESY